MTEKDFLLTIRVQNNRIVRRMRKLGFSSLKKFADLLCDSDYQRIAELVRFKRSPITKKGEWTNMALSVSSALHCEPEELWPERLQQIRAQRGRVEIEANRAELEAIPTHQIEFEAKDFDSLLAVLPARERLVIEGRFGLRGPEKTLDEIGVELGGRSRDRVRQIEAKALNRMRRKARLLQLDGPI